ncbi:MAG TPA: OmpA family protein, partial [Gammaproteobacteria bacterium]|nr:OmpA family protein [Gammaproteobacteria bacterium]
SRMKKLLAGLAIVAVSLAGCAQPQTKTQQGAMIGTGVGAAAGAGLGQAIGGDTKGTLLGAGIGAVVGGLAGGAIGRYMDNQEAAMRQQLAGVEAANVQRNANLLAVTFKSDFLFDVDSAQLKPGSYDEISRVAQVLVQYPQTNIQVAGYTDSTGSEAYNQQLSERRAQVVKNALAGQGVNPARMTVVGYGESKPVAGNDTEAGRQMNRRVEITIAPQRQR